MLLQPEAGLVFWMLVSFGFVMIVLIKFGFPAITNMVDERKTYIEKSLDAAQKANEQLATIKEQSDAIMAEASLQQSKILKDAADTRERIIQEAKGLAMVEGAKQLEEARKHIQSEKDKALRDIRRQVSELSVDVAEKILRTPLKEADQQINLIDRLIDEAMVSKS